MIARSMKGSSLLALLSLMTGWGAWGQSNPDVRGGKPGPGDMHSVHRAGAGAAAANANPPNMVYNGGRVLANSTTYAIWWGKPSDFPPDAVEGIDKFLEDLEGSKYLQIADQYMLGSTAHTHFGGNFFDHSEPTSPLDAQGNDLTWMEVAKVLQNYGLNPDANGIYIVYPSNYPAAAFSAGFCAYHVYAVYTATGAPALQNAYVPNTAGAQLNCGIDLDPLFTPNTYSGGTRAMINMTAHEVMEAITDPNLAAWFAPNGNEIGDSCAYVFQTWVPMNEDKWRIQGIWSNQAKGCAQGAGRETRVLGASSYSGPLISFDTAAAAYGTFPQGINVFGAVAGIYTDANDSGHAFMRNSKGDLDNIDPPGTNSALFAGAYAHGINDEGSIVGHYVDSSFVFHGFRRNTNGTFVVLDAPGGVVGTSARSINVEGVLTGDYADANSTRHCFVRDKLGNFTDFDPPNAGGGEANGAIAYAVNSTGAVTGQYTDLRYRYRGFVRDQYGNISTFDVPGAGKAPGEGTFAWSINDEGAIAGHYTDKAFMAHAFIRDQFGKFTTFDAPGAVYGTFAHSINSDGSVAGYYSDKDGFPRGFVRDKYGNFTTIDTPGLSYGTVLLSINEDGAVTGYNTAPVP